MDKDSKEFSKERKIFSEMLWDYSTVDNGGNSEKIWAWHLEEIRKARLEELDNLTLTPEAREKRTKELIK